MKRCVNWNQCHGYVEDCGNLCEMCKIQPEKELSPNVKMRFQNIIDAPKPLQQDAKSDECQLD